MFNALSRGFYATATKNLTRIKSHEKLIASTIFTGVFRNLVNNLDKKKQITLSIRQENFSTNRQWNPFYVRKSSYERLLEVNGNETCPDCSSTDICYVSTINGGIYCPVCAGVHLELGTHPDFLTLSNDIKVSNEDMQFFESMGNNYVNHVYEAALDITGTNKPTVASPRCEITDYIQKKYLDCSFSISRNDRSSTENVLHFVSNMRLRGHRIPDLREKTNERVGSTYKEIMDEAFDSPYVLQMAE